MASDRVETHKKSAACSLALGISFPMPCIALVVINALHITLLLAAYHNSGRIATPVSGVILLEAILKQQGST